MPKPRNDGLTVAIPEDAEVASEAPSGETSGPAELSSSSSRNKFSPGAVLNKMMPRQLTRVTSSAVARLRSSVDPRKQAALRAELQSNLERTDTPKVGRCGGVSGHGLQRSPGIQEPCPGQDGGPCQPSDSVGFELPLCQARWAMPPQLQCTMKLCTRGMARRTHPFPPVLSPKGHQGRQQERRGGPTAACDPL